MSERFGNGSSLSHKCLQGDGHLEIGAESGAPLLSSGTWWASARATNLQS